MYLRSLFRLLIPLGLLCGVTGKRKLSDTDCYCGLKELADDWETYIHPWTLSVHVGVSPEKTKICVGTVIASNVILTTRNCLTRTGATSMVDLAHIVVSNSGTKGNGNLTYPVVALLQNQSCPGWKNIVGLKVSHDFTSKESRHKPVCIPYQEESPRVTVSEGHNVSVETVGAGVISNLVVKRGQDCDVDGDLKLGSGGMKENVLCVTVTEDKAELEVGQAIYMDVAKNPYASYPYGFFTYLVGISMFVRQVKDGQRHLFFAPVKSFLESIDETGDFPEDTRWCPQPWAWLNAPEKIKRDESLDCECGIRLDGAQGRVVGGEEAIPYEFPWMVKFGIDREGSGAFSPCGGSLISDRVILTASHCLVNNAQITLGRLQYDIQEIDPVLKFKVALHSHKRENDSMEIEVRPRVAIIHPGFLDGERRSKATENDIALVILDKPLNLSQVGSEDGKRLYAPICLPKWGQRIPVEGMDAIVAGWGWMHDSKGELTVGDLLQKLTFRIKPLSVCTEPLQGKRASFNTVFCGGIGDVTAGLGDSGGPVIVQASPGKYAQVGAVGFGFFILGEGGLSGEKTQYTFYQDLQQLLPWVDYHSNLHGARYCKK